jgi:hypothetical protein
MLHICNVFTIAMAPQGGMLRFLRIPSDNAANIIRTTNDTMVMQAVGHEQTAKLANADLGADLVKFNRISVRLDSGDELLICQYVGPRLPEGATTLPEGAELVWYYAKFD